MTALVDFERYRRRVQTTRLTRVRGRVTELTGLIVKAAVPGVRVGERVEILTSDRTLQAEVVGFRDKEVMLMPFGFPDGVGPDSEVIPTGRPFEIQCGEAMLGHVLNGLGEPIDTPLSSQAGLQGWAVERP
ncbi:MAG: EscN/YscN/HrcN family type III secretion system ATPase, partial [Myxococcota bacterium]